MDLTVKIKYNGSGRSSTFLRPDREGEKLRTPADAENGSRLAWMTEESVLRNQVSHIRDQKWLFQYRNSLIKLQETGYSQRHK